LGAMLLEYGELAHRLLEHEAGAGEQPPGLRAGERVCGRLREGLAKLVGSAGFDALMRRALHLARAEHALLEVVEGSDGACFRGLAEGAAGHDPGEVNAALAAVFGHLFSLLASFIGDDLARRQLQRIWPDIPLSKAIPRTEEAAQ